MKEKIEEILNSCTVEPEGLHKEEAVEKLLALIEPLEKENARLREALRFIQRDHFNPLNNRCSTCSDVIETAIKPQGE